MNYKDTLTGICASKEDWCEAFSEFLTEHSYNELPSSEFLKWNYEMKEVKAK